jgi:hypothetical protein
MEAPDTSLDLPWEHADKAAAAPRINKKTPIFFMMLLLHMTGLYEKLPRSGAPVASQNQANVVPRLDYLHKGLLLAVF